MTKQKRYNGKKDEKMNNILSIDKFQSDFIPQKIKFVIFKKTSKDTTTHNFTEEDVKKIYELETRCSNADEFSELWDD